VNDADASGLQNAAEVTKVRVDIGRVDVHEHVVRPMTAGSMVKARMVIGPPHLGQVETSTSQILRRSSAQRLALRE
jgi:hypothetical protein